MQTGCATAGYACMHTLCQCSSVCTAAHQSPEGPEQAPVPRKACPQLGGEGWARAAQVREAGGLRVILASMQYNQRGENQLRGRAGRQGDPGETLALLDAQDRLIQESGSTALIEKYILPHVPQTGAPRPTSSA